jgi:ribonuclease Z
VIYITHMHADHHLGLINLLLKRDEALKGSTAAAGAGAAPILVIGPRDLGRWLGSYSNIEPLNYTFRPHGTLLSGTLSFHFYPASLGLACARALPNASASHLRHSLHLLHLAAFDRI